MSEKDKSSNLSNNIYKEEKGNVRVSEGKNRETSEESGLSKQNFVTEKKMESFADIGSFYKNKEHPEVLVVGPGGKKGMIELGCLLYLIQTFDVMKKIRYAAGCSVGSIILLLLICDFSILDIIEYAYEANLMDGLKVKFDNIKMNAGLMDIGILKERLNKLITIKFGYVPTLCQLYEYSRIHFTCVSYDLTNKCVKYYDEEKYPHVCCTDAVSFSCNIPFVFYRKEHEGSTMIDGAFGNPYPIDVYDNGKRNILGIYLGENTEKKKQTPDNYDIIKYLDDIIHAPINEIRNIKMDQCKGESFNVCLEHIDNDLLGIDSPITEKQMMLYLGYNLAYDIFSKKITPQHNMNIRHDPKDFSIETIKKKLYHCTS